MSEPSNKKWERLLGIFLPAYNKLHSSHFSSKHNIDFSDISVDLMLKNPQCEVLKIQHRVAVADPEREYKKPSMTANFIAALGRELERSKLKKYYTLHLAIHTPPKINEFPAALGQLTEYISAKCTQFEDFTHLIHSIDFDDDLPILSILKKWFSDIEIMTRNIAGGAIRRFEFAFMNSEKPALPWLDPEQVVMIAVRKKAQRYAGTESDLTLLLEFEHFPPDQFYINRIRERLLGYTEHSFKEIWLIYDFINYSEAICVYPQTVFNNSGSSI